MAAPIELPFGLRTWVGPGYHVLDGGPDPPCLSHSVAEWLRRWTRNSEVASSIPGRGAVE